MDPQPVVRRDRASHHLGHSLKTRPVTMISLGGIIGAEIVNAIMLFVYLSIAVAQIVICRRFDEPATHWKK